ncbi:MAG: TIM barrel protein, partial [Nitrospinota bacterium]
MSFFYGREMLLLHTAFWTARHEGAEALLKAIEPLGVAGLSLDDAISPALWKELKGALQGRQFLPLVIHNPLPAPPWLPRERDLRDDLLLASPEREKRERAVAATLRTVELADALGVHTVVLHLGRVGMPSPWGELKAKFEREVLPETVEGVEFLEKLREERADWGGEEMDAACFSLDQLLPQAERMGVKLALESRVCIAAFPRYREARHLFE